MKNLGLVTDPNDIPRLKDIGVGTGDVTGPPSSMTGHLATFADTSGKVIQDGGQGIVLQSQHQQGLVTFVFDDGNDTDYSLMKPVFDAQGVPAVAAIVTDWLDTAGVVTTAQMVALQTAGWEIASHTKTHTNLTTLTESQVRAELADSKAALLSKGVVATDFAYPYGVVGINAAVQLLVREYYQSARGMGAVLNPCPLNTYNLSAYGFDNPGDMATYLASMEIWVNRAASQGKWLIFTAHATNAADVTAMGTLIDYIQAAGLSIVTIQQGLALVGNVLDVDDYMALGEKGFRMGTLFTVDELGNTVIGGSLLLDGLSLNARSELQAQIDTKLTFAPVNLIANGDFETNVDGWGSDATITRTTVSPLVGTGSLKCVASGDSQNAYTSVTLIVGHVYYFAGLVKTMAAAGRNCVAGIGAAFGVAKDCSVSAQTVSLIFTATGTSGFPGFLMDAYVAGEYFLLDSVVCYDLTVGTTATVAELNLIHGITAAGQALIDDANAAAQLTTLGAAPLSPTGATYTPASGAQTVALDVSAGNMHVVSGNASGTAITFSISGATNNQPFVVSILQGGTTVSTITAWFATIRWAGGTAPTLTATLNKRDTFGFIRSGANTYDGFVIGQNA